MCSDKYIQELADKIGYGAQLALYELHTEQQGDMTWDRFVQHVRHSPALRKKIQQVAANAVLLFDKSRLNFELPVDALKYQEDYPDEQLINVSRIFSEKMAHGLMENVFLTFELEHFRRLAAAVPGLFMGPPTARICPITRNCGHGLPGACSTDCRKLIIKPVGVQGLHRTRSCD